MADVRLALLAFIAFVGIAQMDSAAASSGVAQRDLAQGDWRLTIATDRFSGDVACPLRANDGKAFYVGGAVGFQFGRHADVMEAWLRVDAGTVMRWRDQLPELARLRVAIDGRDMSKPTDGIVWLPSALIVEAGSVAIQRKFGQTPRRFSLNGFAALLASAHEQGCRPEARFGR